MATAGRLGDLLGRVLVFRAGVILFAAGSAACALAPALPVLLVGRVVEGLGGALMMPAAAVLVTEAFDPKDRGRAMGAYTAVGSVFLVLGPLVSGALIEYAGWRAVFLLNLPVAAVVLTLAWVAHPVDHLPPAQPLHIGSMVLLAAGLTALVLGIQESHRLGWTSLSCLGLIGGGLLSLVVFVFLQMRLAEPFLNTGLFLDPGFTADAAVLYCGQFALMGQTAFIAIYLQRILEFPPLQAGQSMLLFLVPGMVMAPVAGWLFDRFGVKVPAVLGMALVSLGFFLESQAFPSREFIRVAPCLVLLGLGLGLAMSQTYTDGMSRVPAARRGQAFGILDTIKQLGSTMGMAVIGTLVAAQERPGSAPSPCIPRFRFPSKQPWKSCCLRRPAVRPTPAARLPSAGPRPSRN